MRTMYSGCSSSQNYDIIPNIRINGSNNDIYMENMFSNCSSLNSINFLTLNMSLVYSQIYMNSLFENCQNLTFANL